MSKRCKSFRQKELVVLEENITMSLPSRMQVVFDAGMIDTPLSSAWLAPLMDACVNLPISVCIASADRLRPGFSLIFVNKKFQQMTGFESSEVLGVNCTFSAL